MIYVWTLDLSIVILAYIFPISISCLVVRIMT